MSVTKNNFIVITGGPGSGKTTILHALQQKGHSYVDETARGIIKERVSRGLPPRPSPGEFAKQLFDADCSNFISNQTKTGLLFFDRSLLDSACMVYEADKEHYKQAEHIVNSCRFNNTVFITPLWEEIYTTDTERDQSFADAINVYEKVYVWYRRFGYSLIEIPKAPVEFRVEFMLSEIEKMKKPTH